MALILEGVVIFFDHILYGRLGRLVIIPVTEDKQRLEYDFFEGNEAKDSPNYLRRMEVFHRTVCIISQAFDINFPENNNIN